MQELTNLFWREIKSKVNCHQLAHEKISELKAKSISNKTRNSISKFFTTASAFSQDTVHHDSSTLTESSVVLDSISQPECIEVPVNDTSTNFFVRPTPKQSEVKNNLVFVSTELTRLKTMKNLNLATNETLESIGSYQKKQTSLSKSLKRLKSNATHAKKSRKKKKAQLEHLQSLLPNENIIKEKTGPWPLESTQPELLKVIVDIVMSQSSADEKRRCSILRTCSTLDDLHNALVDKGFTLSRTALYHRLIPKRFDSTEGKRHITTVPVKLIKASAVGRKKHQDSHFAMATVNYLKDLSVVLGSGPVFFLSQDDKCRIPIGLPAATKQTPFLMSMEARVILPDHDFVVASKHKLIPSVYAAAKISQTSVTYSGPTYISIRSGKHSKSDASTHALDFGSLFSCAEFEEVIKTPDGQMKPIVIISVDGGPDENPRFDKNYLNIQNHH